MKLILGLICLINCIDLHAQVELKPIVDENNTNLSQSFSPNNIKGIIDFESVDKWFGLDKKVDVSPNGRFLVYLINNMPYRKSTLVLQSLQDSSKVEFIDVVPGFFSADNKYYIFTSKEGLCFFSLETKQQKCLTGVTDYKHNNNFTRIAYYDNRGLILRNISNNEERVISDVNNYSFDESAKWLACQLNDDKKQLLIRNVLDGKETRFDSVVSYSFSNDGNVILLKCFTTLGVELKWVDILSSQITTVWSSRLKNELVNNYFIDFLSNQLVFIVASPIEQNKGLGKLGEDNHQTTNSIWYYKVGMRSAILKVDNGRIMNENKLMIKDSSIFVNRAGYIRFMLEKRTILQNTNSNGIKVDVWNHQDKILQSAQSKVYQPRVYKAVIHADKNKIVQLESDDENVKYFSDEFSVVQKQSEGDRFWEPTYSKDSNWLVSLKDGSRQLLDLRGAGEFWTSPNGNYLIYFDSEKGGNFFSYNFITGKGRNISANIPAWTLSNNDEYVLNPKQSKRSKGSAGFVQNNKMLVYDNYDIWLLDLTGKDKAVNVTNGYGRSHGIKFSIFSNSNQPIFPNDAKLLLVAFNTINKYNGFFSKDLSSAGNPSLLSMGPYVTYLPGLFNLSIPFNAGSYPIKAKDTDVWIVQRMTAADAPNLYSTTDFKKFTRLSNLQPQKDYNWLTTELIKFRQIDGRQVQGVLYKPTDFDSSKKYPVIFTYYRQTSHRLYQYPHPFYVRAAHLNIPWFVSRGYLVFTPDFYLVPGSYGQSANNAVVGAAKHLSRLPFVDSKRLAISGHSFAGGLTNYIVTHSNLFAAAMEGAGSSNSISSALQFAGACNNEGETRLEDIERETYGGLSIWDHQQLWLANSPVLNAHKVSTPLLIFHCKADDAVPWAQAVEMFVSLRRLNKRAWMLQYDNGTHNVNGKDAKDLTIRVNQYFNHYLKSAPAPIWMSQGIPARLKSITTGYPLDPTGTCGKDCKVCKMWNDKMKKDSLTTLKEIEIRKIKEHWD